MYFYKQYFISFIIIVYMDKTHARGKLDFTSGVGPLSPWSTGLILEARLNNTKGFDYDVEIEPKQCCLLSDRGPDCGILSIIGRCTSKIPRGTTKTLYLVAPLLHPYERKGYCIAFLDSQPSDKQTKVFRDTIKINFDTSLENNQINQNLPNFIRKCAHKDEDPLNSCLPVDCEIYYNEKKSHFSKNLKRCVDIPSCYYNPSLELPNVLYDPTSNLCVGGEIITDDDIKYIKSIVNGKVRGPKDILIIKNDKLDINETDLGEQKLCQKYKNFEINENVLDIGRLGFYKPYMSNSVTIIMFGVVIVVQCCLICTMVYCLVKSCTCLNNKRVIKKFFNRQDISVTTPLIGTSNVDTETTDYQYYSESSNNINNKIKCYKACQKSMKDSIHVSMSDDILAKCLNRRVWQRKSSKSDPVPDSSLGSNETIQDLKKEFSGNTRLLSEKPKHQNDKEVRNKEKHKSYSSNQIKFEKHYNTSLTYENEKNKKNEKKSERKRKKDDKHKKYDTNEKYSKVTDDKSIVTKDEKITSFDNNLADADSDDIRALSEKEIRCHTYIDNSNVTGFKPIARHKHAAFIKTDNAKNNASQNEINRKATEKEAQAYFSNDSIEDFLSERGIQYIDGESTSKYGFSSQTNQPKSSSISEVTSKTSKNSVSKNFLDLFKTKKKVSISDPGASKVDILDLELLHLSKASMASSSLEEQCLKNLHCSKSKTSL